MPQQQSSEKESKNTNLLINESSPYLLQHAHNPVNWMPWGDEALEKAKKENKPILISIGYSACHWCHVMEHESFEDSAVAELMNKNFICIKVDREERPDIDQVYMNAVQLMTGRGGWPLNCFATPEGKPFYGGTYFPKENWIELLKKLNNLYTNEPQKVIEYANKLSLGVRESELIEKVEIKSKFSLDSLSKGLENWRSAFDKKDGGNNQAPKFPIPNNYEFLLNYAFHKEDKLLEEQVFLTLDKMAFGGIYDQIGGGFSRYSTDMKWKVPHFEKMLYDNAQLVSLYSKAYQKSKNPLYQQIVDETITFVIRELTDPSGAFYSALDADSEGEEGKFYVWQKEELKNLLGKDYELAKDYFNINSTGLWEHGNYILLRNKKNIELAKSADLSLEEYEKQIEEIKSKLLKVRDKRVRPGLDDKTLTSWNALMISGLVDAYLTFGNSDYLQTAESNAEFLLKQQRKKDGGLWHNYKSGKSNINGYLEDYSFTIDAFIKLYEASLNEKWLISAKDLFEYATTHFYDEESGLFYFTSNEDPELFARKKELTDNVIPASNSSIARSAYRLGIYFDNAEYKDLSKQMLANMIPLFNTYLPSYSNWANFLMEVAQPYYEVAVCGVEAPQKIVSLHQKFTPNKLIMGLKTDKESIPLLEGKWTEGQTTIYVCENKVCQLPVTSAEEALKQLLN
ncbi:MAG: thioredoxin domain-containing protein [Vicingaceae bacterium]